MKFNLSHKIIAHTNPKKNSTISERYHVQGEKLHIVYLDMLMSFQGHENKENNAPSRPYEMVTLLIYFSGIVWLLLIETFSRTISSSNKPKAIFPQLEFFVLT